ncbi:MAG: DUF554 domain-containing protein [Clostridia bacterium]|nr:DUF554 domain-containing protein [Clostridia bacterium]
MTGLGTIINTLAIIAGGLIGLIFGKKIPARLQDTLMKSNGICVLFIGIAGTLQEMFTVENGKISSGGTMMMIGALSIGAVIGELLNIDGKMERFGEWLKRKTKSEKDNSFVDGFVTASLTVSIGAMAIVGSIKDGIYGDYSILTAKAILDLIIIIIMTASMGKGCIFSAIPVAVLQGSVTLLSGFIEPIMTETALSYLSLTGSMLIFCVGVNLIWGKKIRVANLLPSIVIAVIWAIVESYI